MPIGFIALALFAGMCFAVQASVNANLAKGLGDAPIVATLVSFTVGTLILLMVTVARGGLGGYLWQLPKQPPWTLLGGALVFLTPRVGLANMLLLIIFGQLTAAVTLDHFGWLGLAERPITPVRLLGLGCMLAGVALVLQGDKWLEKFLG